MCWVFSAACGLFLIAESGGYSVVVVCRLLIVVVSLARASGVVTLRFQSIGSVVVAHELHVWALQHVGSSRTSDRTHVPCIAR